MLQDGKVAMIVDREEIQRVITSCNDFAEAEKQSMNIFSVIVKKCNFLKFRSERLFSARSASLIIVAFFCLCKETQMLLRMHLK